MTERQSITGPARMGRDAVERESFFYPLSFAQERQWGSYLASNRRSTTNLHKLYVLSPHVSFDCLAEAVGRAIERQAILRTTYIEGVTPQQQVHMDVPEVAWTRLQVAAISQISADPQFVAWTRAPLALDVAPALRARAIDCPDGKLRVQFLAPHVAWDATSWSILQRDIDLACRQQGIPLPPLTASYGDYARQERSIFTPDEIIRSCRAYAERAFSDNVIGDLDLGAAAPRNDASQTSARAVQTVHHDGFEQVTFARALAALQIAVATLSGHDAVCISAVFSTRDRVHATTAGFFANLVPILGRVGPGDRLEDVERRAAIASRLALRFRHVPRLTEAATAPFARAASGSRAPYQFLINFVDEHSSDVGGTLREEPGEIVPSPIPDMALLIGRSGTAGRLIFTWRPDAIDADRARLATLIIQQALLGRLDKEMTVNSLALRSEVALSRGEDDAHGRYIEN